MNRVYYKTQEEEWHVRVLHYKLAGGQHNLKYMLQHHLFTLCLKKSAVPRYGCEYFCAFSVASS
jgi:hypothetical protein